MPTRTGIQFKNLPVLDQLIRGSVLFQGTDGDSPTVYQAPVPLSIFYPASSSAEARAGTAANRLITPMAMAAVTRPVLNQLDNNWSTSWTRQTNGTNLPNGSPHADFTTITGNIQTATLSNTGINFFYATASHYPVVSGDTLRCGLVATDGATRYALGLYVSEGLALFALGSSGWTRITRASDTRLIQEALGLPIHEGVWYPLAKGARLGINSLAFVTRRATTTVAVYPNYVANFQGSPSYGIIRETRTFSTPASNVTLSQIVGLLENAPDGQGLSYTALDDRPDSLGGGGVPGNNTITTAMLRDGIVTGIKIPLHTIPLDRIDVTGARIGQIPKINAGGTSLEWADESAIDNLGNNSIQTNMYKPHSVTLPKISTDEGTAGMFMTIDSTDDADWAYIKASDVRSGTFNPLRMAASGSANQVLTYVDANTMAWRTNAAISRPGVEVFSAGNSTELNGNIATLGNSSPFFLIPRSNFTWTRTVGLNSYSTAVVSGNIYYFFTTATTTPNLVNYDAGAMSGTMSLDRLPGIPFSKMTDRMATTQLPTAIPLTNLSTAGGTNTNVLTLVNGVAAWAAAPSGGGGNASFPAGGTDGQALFRTGNGSGEAWEDIPAPSAADIVTGLLSRARLAAGASTGRVLTATSTSMAWQLPTPITIVDNASGLPASPSTGDVIFIGTSFTNGGTSYRKALTYRYSGTAWVAISLRVEHDDLGDSIVEGDNIKDETIVGGKYGPKSIDSADMADDAVVSRILGPACVLNSNLSVGCVGLDNISPDAGTNGQLLGRVGAVMGFVTQIQPFNIAPLGSTGQIVRRTASGQEWSHQYPTTNAVAGRLLGRDSSNNIAWVATPTWTQIAGSQAVSNAGATDTANLNTGEAFSNYDEIYFYGRGLLGSMMVPFQVLLNAGSESEGINLAPDVRIWLPNHSDTSYSVKKGTVVSDSATYSIQSVWGRKWA